MHIHYFQHEKYEDPAFIREWADQNNITTSATFFYEDPVFPSMASFDWLIIMGGSMGTCEEEKFPWLVPEKAFIREAMESGKTVLGICLGSQLIADVLGGGVLTNIEPEIGFFTVSFNRDGQSDMFFRHFPKEFLTLHWHGDTFGIPDGATRMASSAATINQAFRWGTRVFALQFHPELTPESAKILLNAASSDLKKNGNWIQDENEILSRLHICRENNRYLSGFLDEIRATLR